MSLDIQICDARIKDAKRICELNKAGLGYEYPLDKTILRLQYILANTSDKLLVALNNQETIGYIHAGAYECTYNDSMKNILALVVDEKFRSYGVGKKLILAIEEWTKSKGCQGIRLSSGYNRTNAHKFYESLGYINRKEQKNFIKIL